MPRSSHGFNQKRFLSTSSVSSSLVSLGSMRGASSAKRLFNYNKQFISVQPIGNYLFSKNNTTSDGFSVGAYVGNIDTNTDPYTYEPRKDMENVSYTDRFDQNDYPNYFPGMAPFTDENIVAGDKSSVDRLISSRWDDWGGDIFDGWGYFYIYDVESGKYYFPLFSPQNQDDGLIFTQIFNAFGSTFIIKHGYPVQGIFKFDIHVNNNKPFKFGSCGNMGSDKDHVITDMMYSYVKASTNLQLYYVKQEEANSDEEIIYSYFIPKKVSQNNGQTYNLYQDDDSDNNSLMSKEVTNGLIVYFSKTNDVKEWIVNDLGIAN
jgi:hypothetical protein